MNLKGHRNKKVMWTFSLKNRFVVWQFKLKDLSLVSYYFIERRGGNA